MLLYQRSLLRVLPPFMATALGVDAARTTRLKPFSNEPGRLVYT